MGWNKMRVRRGDMIRSGNSFDKGWNTVKAVRMTVTTVIDSEVRVRYCDLRQTGGPIYGEVEYVYCYARVDGTYTTLSAPSAVSRRYNFESESAMVEIPADASRDAQVNEIWLFRRGAGLEDFYLVKQEPCAGTGALSILDDFTAVDALVLDVPLQPDNTVPPSDVIDIEGPYYDRLFALTAKYLYPSRRRMPDTFDVKQVIQVAGEDERCLWVKKSTGGLYIGTTKDVYVLSGSGNELPDDTIEFTLTNLNIDNPPISEAVAQEGNQLVYLAADGWRALSGSGSVLLVSTTSLLYRGKTRHGVSPVNMAGRFRAAIAHGFLSIITPEGVDSADSPVLYRYKFESAQWYRHILASDLRSIFREPDGTLIASDTAGGCWELDTGTGDEGADIAIVAWTREDDIGHPFARKDPHDFRCLLDTGGDVASIGLCLDHAAVAAMTLSATQSGIAESLFNLSALASFRNIQVKITGSFSTFRWTAFNMGYHVLPMVMRGHTPPSNFGYPGVKTVVGLQLRVNTLGQAVTITPVLDGINDTAFVVTSATDEPVNYTHMFTYPARQVEEIQLLLGGDVEMYDWQPIVTAKVPLGTLVYDSGPMDMGSGEFIWPSEISIKAVCGDDLLVQLYFDGLDYGTLVASVEPALRGTAAKILVPVPRGYKGRIPRLVITSCEPFFPYWIEMVRRQTKEASEKEPLRYQTPLGGDVPA